MDQQEQNDDLVPMDEALPPRGNLSRGGATVEEPQVNYEQTMGATTVNGGREPQGDGATPDVPWQAQPQAQGYAPTQNMPASQGAWGSQQMYAYAQGQSSNMYAQQQMPPQAYGANGNPQGTPQPYGTPYPQAFAYPGNVSNPYGQTTWPGYAPYPQAQVYAPIPQNGAMQQAMPQTNALQPEARQEQRADSGDRDPFDYSNIDTSARVAIYDDLHSAPRVVRIPGGPTHEFIERIASLTYQHSQSMGGRIPYSVIREVSENFIHAQFKEVVVSILDKGDTIRFTDQGPGIKDKDLVQMPGVTSATEPMKQFIRGVGSGLPLVKDALSFNHGTITIEDNVNSGSVVTISLVEHPTLPGSMPQIEAGAKDKHVKITDNDKLVLAALSEGPAGVTAVSRETGISVSSVHNSFERLTQAGLISEKNKERYLTEQGSAKLKEIE